MRLILMVFALLIIVGFSLPAIALPPPADEFTEKVLELIKQRLFDDALDECNAALQEDYENVIAYCLRAQVYKELKQFDKALDDCNSAVDLNPRSEFAYHMRGEIYHDLKEYENAIADYTRAIEIDPEWSPPYVGRGTVYFKMGKLDLAVKDYDKSIAIDPSYTPAKVSRVCALLLKQIWWILGTIILFIIFMRTLHGRKG